jgi:hypothetical protein
MSKEDGPYNANSSYYYYSETSNWLKGFMLTWYNSNNAGHIVLGQMATNGYTKKANFYGIQMMDWNGVELFALGADVSQTVASDARFYNRIAGWAFNSTTISSGSGSSFTGMKSGTGISFFAGATDNAGTAAKFSVTAAGAITSTSGAIGGWDISSSSISKSSIEINSSTGYLKIGSITSIDPNTTNSGLYAANSGDVLIKTGSTANSNYIRLASGSLTLDTSSFTLKGGTTLKITSAPSISLGTTLPTSASSGTGIWIDGTGIYGLNTNVVRFKFLQDGSGYVGSSNLSWTTAGALTAGSWTIASDKITAGAAAQGLSLNYSSTPFLTGSGFEVWDPAAAKLFIGSKTGSRLTWNSDKAGQLAIYSSNTLVFETTASGAKIGGWSVTDTTISSTNMSLVSGGSASLAIGTLSSVSPNVTTKGLYASNNGDILIKASSTANSGYIKVDSASGGIEIVTPNFSIAANGTVTVGAGVIQQNSIKSKKHMIY